MEEKPTLRVEVKEGETVEEAFNRAVVSPDDWIVVDGQLESVTTKWPTNRMMMSLATTREQAEYEAERLGEIARLEHPCMVKIHEREASIESAMELPISIEGVRTDHKTAKVTISFSTGSTEDNVSKAKALGFWANRGTHVTARFTSRQMGFSFNQVKGAPVEEEEEDD
jgi:hypothetical protein